MSMASRKWPRSSGSITSASAPTNRSLLAPSRTTRNGCSSSLRCCAAASRPRRRQRSPVGIICESFVPQSADRDTPPSGPPDLNDTAEPRAVVIFLATAISDKVLYSVFARRREVYLRRVVILGGSGTGKSTLARELGQHIGLPVVHLDVLYWRPGWQEPDTAGFRARTAAAIAGDAWISEGNYRETFDLRLPRADTVIILEAP